MKKLLLTMVIFAGFLLAAHMPMLHVSTREKGVISATFAPLQLTAWENIQLYDSSSHTLISLGVLTQQRSAIFSFAPANGIEHNFFLQSGLITSSPWNYFAVAGLFNFADKNYGLQLGVSNLSQYHYGFQAGLINIGSLFQTGVFNCEGKIQVGVINSNGDFQIGLINYNPKAWIPWMPLINFSIPEKKSDPAKITSPHDSDLPAIVEIVDEK